MENKLEKLLSLGRRLAPRFLFELGQRPYHFLLAFLGMLWYNHPSRDLKVIAVTGTKGKTTTVEILNAILEEAGFQTAISSTLRSKVGEEILPNLYKMTTPGRFFIQRLLRKAIVAGCEYAIIEMTSQAVLHYRHKFIQLDGLIFTGIHAEHIEAHGSFEKYLAAKLEIAKAVGRSPKRPRSIVANADDTHGMLFLDQEVENKIGYHLDDWDTYNYKTRLPGNFNRLNILGAAAMARTQGVGELAIAKGVAKLANVPGRMESLDMARSRGFEVIVDYAHTGGSIEEVYKLFKGRHTVCVLGSCGGGRDKWVRPIKGKLAETYCSEIILTDEDPYDEDPEAIVGDILSGMTDQKKAMVEMDRRKAIHKALTLAKPDSVVLITGKGTDPYIMGKSDRKMPWSDKLVAEEELAKLK
jgi:UDP-N-acetylmuramoyl-L-alanyl-D-glutamate--2,6-diaminopimelate ligase